MSSRKTFTTLIAVVAVLIIIAGVVGYFIGSSKVPALVTTTITTTATITITSPVATVPPTTPATLTTPIMTITSPTTPTPIAPFRAIPKEWLDELMKKYANLRDPRGPNNETTRLASEVALTPDEIEKAKKLTLKEMYYLIATPDPTEQLNMIGQNRILKMLGFKNITPLAAWSLSEQIDQVDSLVPRASGISFVVLEPYATEPLGAPAKRLADAGVPIMCIWSTPTGLYGHPNYIGLVTDNGYARGVLSAEMLAYMLNYTGKIGIIYFALSFWTTDMRLKGALDTFAKYPGIQIVDMKGFTDVSQARDLVAAMLSAHPDIRGLWVVWMIGPATGAAEAVKALGLQHKVVIVTTDLGGIEGAKAIADPDNPIKATVEPDLIAMGEVTINATIKWLLGEKEAVRGGYWVVPVYAISRSNLVEMWNITGNNLYFGPLPKDIIDLLQKPWPSS